MDIKIFHFNGRQAENIYWLIIARGVLFYVNRWECETPTKSSQEIEDMFTHPHYLDGQTQLPRFYLKTTGQIEIRDHVAYITA